MRCGDSKLGNVNKQKPAALIFNSPRLSKILATGISEIKVTAFKSGVVGKRLRNW